MDHAQDTVTTARRRPLFSLTLPPDLRSELEALRESQAVLGARPPLAQVLISAARLGLAQARAQRESART
jgi:hypothetical protein